MKYSIEKEGSGVIIRFIGKITMADIIEAKVKYHGSEIFDTSKYSIWDFTDCEASQIKPGETDLPLAYHLGASRSLEKHRLALVAKDRLISIVCKKFASELLKIGTTWKVRVFNDFEDALAWGKE